jgi:hypothetical protein
MRMILHGLVSELLESDDPDDFSQVHSINGLAELLTKSIRDLRLAELSVSTSKVMACESSAKARDVKLS